MSTNWYNDREKADMTRQAYNQMQNDVTNMSPGEMKFVKIVAGVMFASCALLVVALVIRLILGAFGVFGG